MILKGDNMKVVITGGVTLPFISYGGSSLVMTSIMIGIILGIVRHDTKGR